MEARIYVTSVKGKHVCKLGFAEDCGKKCLICSAGLLISVSELYVSVSWLTVLKSMEWKYDEMWPASGVLKDALDPV